MGIHFITNLRGALKLLCIKRTEDQTFILQIICLQKKNFTVKKLTVIYPHGESSLRQKILVTKIKVMTKNLHN